MMKVLRKFFARNRIRKARKRLASKPSPVTYAALAQEYALLGMTREVQQTCEEGLGAFPGNVELARMSERARRLEQDSRLSEIKGELEHAPRPALWRELCKLLIGSNQLARAAEVVERWSSSPQANNEVHVLRAQVCLERYLADRGRDQGRAALVAIEAAMAHLPGDARPLRLRLKFTTRLGALEDARNCVEELLKLAPGDPVLEARFRSLAERSDKAPTIDRALIEVERTGRFSDELDSDDEARSPRGGDVRPILRKLAEQPDVTAASYVRGATALVRGPKGATAERHARAVRNVLKSGRATGRRLGLGTVMQIQIEGEFGTLAIAPGELDAGAVWTTGHLSPQRERELAALAGMNAATDQEDES